MTKRFFFLISVILNIGCMTWTGYESIDRSSTLYLNKEGGYSVIISDSLPLHKTPSFGDIHMALFILSANDSCQNLVKENLEYDLLENPINDTNVAVINFSGCYGSPISESHWAVYSIRSNHKEAFLEFYTDQSGKYSINKELLDMLNCSDSLIFIDQIGGSRFNLNCGIIKKGYEIRIELNAYWSDFDKGTLPFRGQLKFSKNNGQIVIVHSNISSSDSLIFGIPFIPSDGQRKIAKSVVKRYKKSCR